MTFDLGIACRSQGKEASALFVYRESLASDWQDSLRLLAAGAGVSRPLVRVTSLEGMTSTLVGWDEFTTGQHNEDVLAVSIDWVR
jgi:hypothetical protein